MTLVITEGSADLAVNDVSVVNDREAVEKARKVAHGFLNTLSWKHGVVLAFDQHSQKVDSVDQNGRIRSSISVGDGGVGIEARVVDVKKDSSGKVIEVLDSRRLGRVSVRTSEAAAYYRHALLVSDPYDRFRNLYLATENIASKIEAKKGLNKQSLRKTYGLNSYEEGLLRLALEECFAGNQPSLSGVYPVAAGEPLIPAVVKILYRGHRCELNHSKVSDRRKLPFDPEDEKSVQAAMLLMDFVAKSLLEYEDAVL